MARVLRLVVSLVLILFTGKLAGAGCVINQPISYAEAVAIQPPEGSPEIDCLAPPLPPCIKPSPPTIVGSPLTNEVVLEAVIPEGYSTGVSWWQVFEEESAAPGVHYYTATSKEAVDDRIGSVIRMGLPGLRKGTAHRVSVGFCTQITSATFRACTCWSDPITVSTRPAFDAATPDEPPRSNMQLKTEDLFERPPTRPQTTSAEAGTGDGVGPNAV